MARGKDPPKEYWQAVQAGIDLLHKEPLFATLIGNHGWLGATSAPFPPDGFARLRLQARYGRHTVVEVNPWRHAAPEEWANVLGQALVHLYMCHVDPAHADEAWQIACTLVASDFIRQIGIGRRPDDLPWCDLPSLGRDPAAIAAVLRDGGPALMAQYAGHGLAGRNMPTFVFHPPVQPLDQKLRQERQDILATAIRRSVLHAVETAGSVARGPATSRRNPNSLAEQARSWFVTNYPLLGSLAAAFDIVEDAAICAQLDIAIAAIDGELRRVYVNPHFPWTRPTMQFVMAHELLHVGLRHGPRRQGRDPYLWNVACDYVINGWLVEMGIGEVPIDGLLLDPELELEKESAEAIYDRIVGDLRLLRRLNKSRTLRGQGKVDVLDNRPPAWWNGPGTDLDSFYRRALAQGLDLHLSTGMRGTLPGELVEEIRSLQHPPIPWDVRLGHWLDAFFPPLQARRSFARASRRQAATPDIPRPVWLRPDELLATRTFAVVLDTSGSMTPNLLARALGAIASYAMSREVPLVWVLQCDAGVHDMGLVEPESLLGKVEVRGRGGTVLQPAIARLEGDERFPKDAPVLLITDGACDPLTCRREHAFLMPEGARLPFPSVAPRFHVER